MTFGREQVLYLYGITDARHPPEPPPLGLEDQAAVMVPLDGMAAVIGQLTHGRPEASERHLREHFRVVEAYTASHTVLPVRFGTAFPGLAELQAHVVRAHDAYSIDLRRLRAQIEVSVRAVRRVAQVCPSDGAEAFVPAGDGAGARYIAEKRALAAQTLAQQRQRQDLADYLMERLAASATQVESRAVPVTSNAAGVSLAFLLPREGLIGFRDAVAALRASEPGLEIQLAGPWPPYSFVSAPEAADKRAGNS
jgi:hypothetical protein